MNEKELKRVFNSSLKNRDTIALLEHFIDKSGCFRQGLAPDDRTEIYKRGYADFGLYIRSLFIEYAPEIYSNIIIRKDN